ncbi:MAG TPA: NADP-dependent malic enzyme [Candidatus Cybelea sp.]|nr:NADP-dependent malic enzyme [Candidatus Cybelea sp.]
MADDSLKAGALEYHRYPRPGKLAIVATKPLANQRDLALAYSPGVAAACEAIVADPRAAAEVTSRSNLVAVVTNGTAVLGLGAIGPLAAKPVMEGKAVLFKKFADIDVFDLEINETDPKKFVDIVASLEPSFGGINLEDVKAPECFEIEQSLRDRMKIPVMHDDQHGTAIIVAAALMNGLEVVGKPVDRVKIVTSGAGAAALACLDLLVALGFPIENIIVSDIAGVVYEGRKELMDPRKARYARKTDARTLGDAIKGADVFLGLSAPGVLKPVMVAEMADRPIVFALANPTPEIMPEEAKAVRPDAVIATGRSDYPNQVNNVLCFPYIFRGALDVGATAINEAMKIACVQAIARLARAEASDVASSAYGGESLQFGADYLIPRPFDPRLIMEIAPAVARAAMESGVATRPIADWSAYRDRLQQFVFRSGLVMKPLFERARNEPKRVVYAEGEEERVLRAVQTVVDEGLAKPILVGRRAVILMRIERLGLRLEAGRDFELCDPENDPRYKEYWTLYHSLTERRGVSPDVARDIVRTRPTAISSLMLLRGEADAMLCGTVGRFHRHLEHVSTILGRASGTRAFAAMTAIILPTGTFFLADTEANPDPTEDEIAETTILSAAVIRRFGLVPKAALLSHSNFGTDDSASARKMRRALGLVLQRDPELEVEGEMRADSAVDQAIRNRLFPSSRLTGKANLLVMPNLDAANIALNLLRHLGQGTAIGPILLGARHPAHVLSPSLTVRGIVNMTAVAVVEAQDCAQHRKEQAALRSGGTGS